MTNAVKIIYFQQRPIGYDKGSYPVDQKDVEELIKKIIYKSPENNQDLDDDVVNIIEVSTFSNGAKVTAEAQKWVVDELRSRSEIKQE